MKNKHGSLENEIMNVIWDLEEATPESTSISVNDVFALLNEGENTRAYTTIKTVMDRLVEKDLLIRKKTGKKFCYSSLESRNEIAQKAIKKLAKQYFRDDIKLMMNAIEKSYLQHIS